MQSTGDGNRIPESWKQADIQLVYIDIPSVYTGIQQYTWDTGWTMPKI